MMIKYILLILLALNIFFSLRVILFFRKTPSAGWAWSFILLFIPFCGIFMYFLFGLESYKYKDFIQKAKQDKELLKSMEKFLPATDAPLEGLKALNLFTSNAPICSSNAVTFYHSGADKFEELINDITNAKKFIHIQYYILKNDKLGRRIMFALAAKAKEGVEVKVFVDKLGSRLANKKFFAPLLEAGGDIVIFASSSIIQFNFRNHRKICIVDGAVGYIGGFNIGNEYLGIVRRFGQWRDCHMRLVGDGVKALEARFIMDYNYSTRSNKINVSEFYFPKAVAKPVNPVDLQIISSGPDTEHHGILYAYIKMFGIAKKNIYIQTPYFVPDNSLLEVLTTACLSGVDVKIMIPAKPDHPFVYWAALSYLGDLIKIGAKCYKFEGGFVHSKLVMIDGEIASVGTANMDIRSLKLNFEINAFLYNAKEVKFLEDKFMVDVSNSTIIDYDWYENRPNSTKIKESLCRLISPLL